MSAVLLFITGLIYCWVAGDQLFKENAPMAGAFFAYAVANFCFMATVK